MIRKHRVVNKSQPREGHQTVRDAEQPLGYPNREKRSDQKPNIVMVVENYFPSDTRVRNEAQSLSETHQVKIVSLKREMEPFHEVWNDIEIFRIPELRLPELNVNSAFLRGASKKVSYMLYYLYFTSVAAAVFVGVTVRSRCKVLHIHNPPDTLFVLGILAKLFRMKFVYDHHDLAPELFLTRFSQKGWPYKLLIAFEGFCCKLADVVIETNESYRQVDIGRHKIDPAKTFIVRNDPVLAEWQGQTDGGDKKARPSLLYVGCVNPQDGVEVLVETLHRLGNIGCRDFTCTIVGDGDSLTDIKRMVEESGLDGIVEFPGYIYDRQRLKEYFREADVCLEPAPDNPLNRHSTFIKIIEYMAAGKPVVAFDLTETRFSTSGCARLVPPGDVEAFAQAVKSLIDDEEMRKALGKKASERVVNELNWGSSSLNLHAAYKRLG